jgi:hypothetical protein
MAGFRVKSSRVHTAVLRLDDLQRQAVIDSPYRDVLEMLALLLTPVALIAAILAIWRYGADAGWADSFIVSDGLLSHWQVWLGIAVGIQWFAIQLTRQLNRSRK